MKKYSHKEVPAEMRHLPYQWEVDNIDQAMLLTVSQQEIGGLLYSHVEKQIYQLVDTAPTFRKITLEGDTSFLDEAIGGDLSGTIRSPRVLQDSHVHTPGLSIPSYPTTLPPSGPVGGDAEGNFPNIYLKLTGVNEGTYTSPTLTVDAKGRITNCSSNVIGEANLGLNIGTGIAIFKEKEDETFKYSTITAQYPLEIEDGNTITISAPYVMPLQGGTFTGHVTMPSTNIEGGSIKSLYRPYISSQTFNGTNIRMVVTEPTTLLVDASTGSEGKIFLNISDSNLLTIPYSKYGSITEPGEYILDVVVGPQTYIHVKGPFR